MTEIQVNQNTPEWHAWRDDGIGASDSYAIMELSPWVTPFQLWQQKLGLLPRPKMNKSMERGRLYEDEARQAYEAEFLTQAPPKCFQHDAYPFLRASLDGLTPNDTIVEIKVPGTAGFSAQVFGVPDHYYCQIQHQLFVADKQKAHYWVYSPEQKRGLMTEVERNEEFISRLLEAECAFWDKVLTMEAPEISPRDYCQRSDPQWIVAAAEWKLDRDALKIAEENEKRSRHKVICLSGETNTEGGDVRCTFTYCKGRVDYSTIPELKSVDLDKYRKEPTKMWRLSCKE
jgi:putative phage-type endonuclease